MEFERGQLIIILAPFTDYEIYANVSQFDSNTLILETKTNPDIHLNSDILCIAVGKNGMFEFYTQIDIKENNLLFAKRPAADKMTTVEQRSFNRVDCEINFLAMPVSINNISILNSNKKFSGVICNISAGGILAETNLNLPVGMVFTFKLKLNFFIDCKVKVVRTEPGSVKNIYHSGCQFMDMDLESIKAISLYTFKEHLNRKRKDLNIHKLTKGGKNENDE